MDAATKAGLLELIDHAVEHDWTVHGACRLLELNETRAWRWLARRQRDELADRTSGGNPSHGLLDDEVDEIVALFHEWGEVDRSHRKLAHRGSYLGRVWVSPSTVRRVLAGQGLFLKPLPRLGRSQQRPFPDWVTWKPNSIWIYDTTHFPTAGMAVTVVEDLVSRKWIADIVSSEETSTQIEIVFTDALEAEGLLEQVTAIQDGLARIDIDDEARPVLLAVSDIHTGWAGAWSPPLKCPIGAAHVLTSCLLSVVAAGYRTDDVRPVENPATDEHEQLHERVGSLIANVWCVALLAGAVSLAGTTPKETT